MPDFTVDFGDTLAFLNELPARLEEATERILDRAATVALQAEQREADKTYARPIPTNVQVYAAKKQIDAGKKVRIKGGKKAIGTGGGKPAWRRSGDLKSQLSITEPSKGVREIGPQGSSEEYFEHLANLPTGALGINRSNDIRGKAYKVTEDILPTIMAQEISNELGRS